MLEVSNLSFRDIINGIGFKANAGEMIGIIGHNGAGKSTLLKCMMRFNTEYTGSIAYDGKQINTLHRRELARQFSYIPQSFSIDFDLSVREFLFHSRYAYMENRKKSYEKITEAADLCHINPILNRNMRVLSGGEIQKVMLCAAVTQDCPVWLCDEPTSSLDPKAEVDFFHLLRKIRNERNLTVMIVSHNLAEIINRSDRIIAMKNGRIMLDETNDHFTADILSDVFETRFESAQIKGRKLLFTREEE